MVVVVVLVVGGVVGVVYFHCKYLPVWSPRSNSPRPRTKGPWSRLHFRLLAGATPGPMAACEKIGLFEKTRSLRGDSNAVPFWVPMVSGSGHISQHQRSLGFKAG